MLRTRAFPLTLTFSSHLRTHVTTRAFLCSRTPVSLCSPPGLAAMGTGAHELAGLVAPTSSSSSSFGASDPGGSGEPRLASLEDMFDADDAPRRSEMTLEDDGESMRRAETDLGLASVVHDALNTGEQNERPPPLFRAGSPVDETDGACEAADEELGPEATGDDEVPNEANDEKEKEEEEEEDVENILVEEDMEELAAAVEEKGAAPALATPMFFKDAGAAKPARRVAPHNASAEAAAFDDMAAEDVELESVGEAMPSPKRR